MTPTTTVGETPDATPAPAPAWTPTPGKALVLRTCNPDMTSRYGFTWPGVGEVAEAPDWDPVAACGYGLHGLLWGQGSAGLLGEHDDRWLVVEVDEADVVDLDGKVKFPRGLVVHVGTRDEAVALVQQHAPKGTRVVYGTATAGYGGTATAGYRGTATAGYGGTATAGYGGTATAGDGGTATAGYGGTATAGYGGTATAGYGGLIAIIYWDGRAYRKAFGEVGQGGIEPGVEYVVVDGALARKDAQS